MKLLYKNLMLSALALAAALAVSCGKPDDQPKVRPVLQARTNPVAETAGRQFLDVTASGDWTVAVSGGDWLTVSPDHGSGSTSITLNYAANPGDVARTAQLVLRAGNGESRLDFTQNGQKIVPPDPDPTPFPGSIVKQDVAPVKWLELPETKAGDGLDFFAHKMEFNGKRVRNYSFDWDYKRRIAPWVAYPMVAAYARKGTDRTDAWGLDPLLPREQQQMLFDPVTGNGKAYREGDDGWRSRGHQIPSADRLFSYEANVSTFYSTNMTPQANDFNGGIWANLEMRVRNWANKSDTVYVLTGCFGDTGHYVLDFDNNRISIPQGYYKAVLCKLSGSPGFGAGGYAGCAVCFDDVNHGSKEPLKDFAMSIADLEKKLKMNFFVNLPAVIGKEKADRVEAENPQDVSWWW